MHGIENGYLEQKFETWTEFAEYVQTMMLNYNDCIWRGQRKQIWNLSSTLDRKCNSLWYDPLESARLQKAHLNNFKLSARGKISLADAKGMEDNEWWALGQHHGLATPLLDWTESPFVAAFFAFSEQPPPLEPPNQYRAVYFLHETSAEKVDSSNTAHKESIQLIKELEKSTSTLATTSQPHETEREIEFIRPMASENPRLVSQRGLFVACRAASIEDWVRTNFANETTNIVLQKSLIPEHDREIALKSLNRMNINHSTLFPDLDGASRHINLSLDIPYY